MFLIIVGTGAMGKILKEYAEADGSFEKIALVEPLKKNWPQEKADLIIDFSHPEAIKDIYEYCRDKGGNIPVVMGTTGQTAHDEEIIKLLRKICAVDKRSNFSRGIGVMNEAVHLSKNMLPDCDIGVEEVHHNQKKDAPSGTAKTMCDIMGISYDKAVSLRLGTVFGQHRVYFALDDEVLEIVHTAYSKKIFAAGALEAGKRMIKID